VLAEIGDRTISRSPEDEITRAIVDRARQMPDASRKSGSHYRKNLVGRGGVRAPIFERRWSTSCRLAKVTDKTVSREELFKEDEDENEKSATT